MLGSIMSMFTDLFGHCANWLAQIMASSQMAPVWLGGFVVWSVYRFLLSPLFGVASSDIARSIWRSSKASSKAGSNSSGSSRPVVKD